MGAHKERKGEETPDPFTGSLCVLHKIKTYKKNLTPVTYRLEDTLPAELFFTCLKFGVLNEQGHKEALLAEGTGEVSFECSNHWISSTDSKLNTCQLSRLRHESHACRLKTSITRRLTLAGQFLTPD